MLDRRAFLVAGGSSLALLGPDAALRAQGAVVTRRSIRGMSASDPDLAAMRRAVAAMKRLPQSDARNWIRFADIHRNFCPHANWYFLPWHRAYIRAFEGICRELSGKPDFALPYWNWTADRQFPAAFASGDRDSNPLFHPRPGLANGLRLTDDMVGPAVMSAIMSSPDFEAFGSTRPRGQNSAAASWQRRAGAATALEFNPHNGVHQAIGGNMSVIALSARDPIFFLHHANVDRCGRPGTGAATPTAQTRCGATSRSTGISSRAPVRPGTSASAISVRRRRSATAMMTIPARSPPIS